MNMTLLVRAVFFTLVLSGLGGLTAAQGGQLVATVTPAFTQDSTSLAKSLGNTTVLLQQGIPQLTIWSNVNSTCAAGAGGASVCTPLHWIAAALRNVYETDSSRQPVAERSGTVVLDTTSAQWTAADVQLGQPAAAGYQASMYLPYKQALTACPGGAAAPGATPGGVTFLVQLFGGEANMTYFNTSQELLPGNVKLSVRVESWPFCGPTNALVLEFGYLPVNASDAAAANQSVVVQQGAAIQADVAEQESLLTGAADPNSVPVAETQSTTGRRLLARWLLRSRGGGFGGSSRPSTRPTSPNPTTTTTPKPSTTTTAPTRPSGTSPGGISAPAYRPYFPNGGNSRPRYSSSRGAISALPFSATQRPFLNSRFGNNRPVYGFGRRPFLPYSTFLFFPLLLGAGGLHHGGYYTPMIDAQNTAILNNSTLINITTTVPPAESTGVQPMLVTLPSFQGAALYDPIIAISESDLQVTDDIQAAIVDVLAYDAAPPNAAQAAAGGSRRMLLSALLAAAAAAAFLL